MTVFSLSIDTRTGTFGETAHGERAAIIQALHDVVHEVGSGHPLKGVIMDRALPPNTIGTYSWGPGAVNK